MQSKRLGAAAVAALLLMAAPARLSGGDREAFIVMLIDTSKSIRASTDEYARAFRTIVQATRGGDRVLLAGIKGRIGGDEASTLRHVLDRELPPFSVVRDNPITHGEAVARVRADLTAHFERIVVQPRSDRTELVRSLRDSGRIFAGETRRRKLLVVFSDLLEDSLHDFSRVRLSDAFSRALVSDLRDQGLMPNLAGVEVYVVLPGTTKPAKGDELERFWTAFFQECRAVLPPQNYGTVTSFRRAAR